MTWLIFQLTECCVNVLVTTFKETVLQECAQMIRNNETDSKFDYRKNKKNQTHKTIAVLILKLEECGFTIKKIEPSHEIMALFVLRKLILQTRLHSHPVGPFI